MNFEPSIDVAGVFLHVARIGLALDSAASR